MIKLFRYFSKKEWGLAALCVAFIAAQVWLELTIPDYMSEITQLVQTPGSEMHDILIAGGKMLLCALGSLVSSVIVAVGASRIAANFSALLRGKLFDKVQSFSMKEIGGFSTASLITRSTNDVTQVQMVIVMGLQVIVKAPIMATWAICKIAGKSSQWTFSTAVAVAVLLVMVIICIALAMPKFKRLQELTDNLNRITRENINGIRVVRAYNAEEYQEKKFEDANETLTATHLFTGRTMSTLMPGIQLVMNGLSLAIYWIGAIIIDQAALTDKIVLFSDMVVFLSYAMQVVMSFMMLVMIFIMLPRASVAAKRILEVLDTSLSIVNGSAKDGVDGMKGEIEFRNVSFHYPDAEENVLSNISFTASRGETVAFIGSTGSGKSTVINLVPRFYDATEGEVIVDGVNVKDYDEHALRQKIGYVSQKAVLFSGTVSSNVAYGEGAEEDFDLVDIKSAVRTAQATDFVEKMPEEYGGHIAQGGSNLSGGQKQRLSIARALCRKPEILIFDDSFSALDYKTDRILRNSLKEECADATKLIVAQRIGTIMDADRIIVLDEGRIAGMGKHNELLKDCEVYRQIALSQLSKEELE